MVFFVPNFLSTRCYFWDDVLSIPLRNHLEIMQQPSNPKKMKKVFLFLFFWFLFPHSLVLHKKKEQKKRLKTKKQKTQKPFHVNKGWYLFLFLLLSLLFLWFYSLFGRESKGGPDKVIITNLHCLLMLLVTLFFGRLVCVWCFSP